MKKIKYLFVMILLIPNLKVNATTTGTVTVDDYLNIRNIVGGEVTDKLTNGTEVKVLNTEVGSNNMCNSWYQISYGTINKTGYACGDYITLLKGYASCVENDDPLNIWTDINKSGKVAKVACDKEMEILDKDINSKIFLHDMAFKGLDRRLKGNVTKKYQDRLNYELDIIDKMGFNDYFLIVYDYVLYAKKNGILVGPGRGSAAGARTR